MNNNREDIKVSVLRALRQGRDHALAGKQLAYNISASADGDDRNVRIAIRELITDGYPIASVTYKPAGFFIAETQLEVEAYAKGLRSRLIEDALRRRDFLRASKKITHPGQLKMFLV